jgi:hypothetical protein
MVCSDVPPDARPARHGSPADRGIRSAAAAAAGPTLPYESGVER